MENINLKEIVREIFYGKGFKIIQRADGKDTFDTYYNTTKAQFDKILQIAEIDKDIFKIGKDYAIPIEDKELVKILLEEVNSIYAKGLRLKNPDKYTKYDRFDFLLKIEKRLDEKFKGEELIRQKEKFYGYSNLSSQCKVYSIKQTIMKFLDLQLPKLQINDEDIKSDKESLKKQEDKIKALQKNDLKEFFELIDEPKVDEKFTFTKEDDKNIGFYTLTENDRILVLDLYEKIIEEILKELKVFTAELSECREFFGGKSAKEIFIQAIDDYKETLEIDGEPMPEECIKAIEELLKERKMKKRATEE